MKARKTARGVTNSSEPLSNIKEVAQTQVHRLNGSHQKSSIVLSVDTPSPRLPTALLKIPPTTISIPSGAHFRANMPYQGTNVTLITHQTWGAPPYVRLDNPSFSAQAPMYILPNLIALQSSNTISPLPNLVYNTSVVQPSLGELYFPTNTHNPEPHSSLAYHLQVRPVLEKFEIPKMSIFGLKSNPISHLVNYNIYMDPKTTSKDLKCRAFLAILKKQEKSGSHPLFSALSQASSN
ncbi:hypothetical protein ACLOJK_013899 [Asimina triloba]